MSDKEKDAKCSEEKLEILKEKIDRSRQDIPFAERVPKMQAPDPWPDPPKSEQEGGDKGEEK